MPTQSSRPGAEPHGTPTRSLRPSASRAVSRLERALGRGRRWVALAGPPGIGCSTALAALGEALAGGFRVVRVADPALLPRELCTLALGVLGEPAGAGPEERLLRAAATGLPVLLVIDDAEQLPAPTAQRLGELLVRADGSLRLALATRLSGLVALREALPGDGVLEPLPPLDRRDATALLGEAAPPGERRDVAPEELDALVAAADGMPAALLAAAAGLPRASAKQAPPALRDDPFNPVPDPARYVPRAATETALAELQTAILDGVPCLALVGPPGIGKTLMLRVLAGMLIGERRVLHIPYPALGWEDLCRWMLSLLGSRREVEAESELALALARADPPVVLAVDDAAALPASSLEGLATLAEVGTVQVLLCGVSNPWTGVGAPGCRVVTLTAPLSAAEAGALLSGRSGERDAAAAFDAATLGSLHEASRGIPGALLRRAAQLREDRSAPLAPAHALAARPARAAPVRAPQRAKPAAPASARSGALDSRWWIGLAIAALLAAAAAAAMRWGRW